MKDEKYRISIKNKEFTVDGKKIWINGVNTPWHKWNDFGGSYDVEWWGNHFAELHEAGINASRVWLNCNNDQGAVIIGNDGMVSGVSQKHWDHLDSLFEIAEKNNIYIMATLLSFDHFKDDGFHPDAQKWRNMLLNDKASQSFAVNYTTQLVKRYKDNPRLWSIDICNEPEWVFENPKGVVGGIEWERISYFIAANAAVIHENSDVLVTVGMSFPKYYVYGDINKGNMVSDDFLQKLYPDDNAYMDFWSPHYYDWVGKYWGIPFYCKPSGKGPGGWWMEDSKLCVMSECSAKGIGNNWDNKNIEIRNIKNDFENAYLNGWQGVMPWTSNNADGSGGLADMSAATKYMADKYRDVIFPLG